MAESPFVDLLETVCAELERLGLTYAITGSVVSSVYGEPYTSQDVDICLNMTEAQAAALAKSLPPRFYRSEEAMCDAARRRAIANLIDTDTGLKVDLCVIPDEPFYRSVLARRRQIQYATGGSSFWTVSPEDVILMKLLWRRDTQSQKQWDNALSVVRTQGAGLDWPYLHDWAARLGVPDDLHSLKQAAGI